jgi:lipopolysaccharide biosynthesis glycosyltransferase
MVMKPSKEEFGQMLEDISKDKDVPDVLKSGQPEQDYLTRFYRDKWHHLSVRYNYQPHQLAFTDRRGLENCERLTLDYLEISIVHFSASVKPRDLLINPEYREQYMKLRDPEQKFAEEVLLKQYLKGVDSDRRKSGKSKHSAHVIEAQLRAATRASTGEWFHHWHALEERFAELTFLIDTAEMFADEPQRRRCSRSRSRQHRAPRRGQRFRRGRGR